MVRFGGTKIAPAPNSPNSPSSASLLNSFFPGLVLVCALRLAAHQFPPIQQPIQPIHPISAHSSSLKDTQLPLPKFTVLYLYGNWELMDFLPYFCIVIYPKEKYQDHIKRNK
jgi:hypothetical protein